MLFPFKVIIEAKNETDAFMKAQKEARELYGSLGSQKTIAAKSGFFMSKAGAVGGDPEEYADHLIDKKSPLIYDKDIPALGIFVSSRPETAFITESTNIIPVVKDEEIEWVDKFQVRAKPYEVHDLFVEVYDNMDDVRESIQRWSIMGNSVTVERIKVAKESATLYRTELVKKEIEIGGEINKYIFVGFVEANN